MVIAIIGILASLLLPALTRARQAAQEAACKNSLKQIMLAKTLYADDNNQVFFDPRAPGLGLGDPTKEPTTEKWHVAYNEYLGGPPPVDATYSAWTHFSGFDPVASPVWNGCPGWPRAEGVTQYHFGVIDRDKPGNYLPTFGMNVLKVNNPAEAGILMEANKTVSWLGGEYRGCTRFYCKEFLYDERTGISPDGPGFRHGKPAWNVGFLDGHVDSREWRTGWQVRQTLSDYGLPSP